MFCFVTVLGIIVISAKHEKVLHGVCLQFNFQWDNLNIPIWVLKCILPKNVLTFQDALSATSQTRAIFVSQTLCTVVENTKPGAYLQATHQSANLSVFIGSKNAFSFSKPVLKIKRLEKQVTIFCLSCTILLHLRIKLSTTTTCKCQQCTMS